MTRIKLPYYRVLTFLLIAIGQHHVFSQDQEERVDLSKPTNIYTRINNNIEHLRSDGVDNYGYRINYNFAMKKFQGTIEVPFLYNTLTKEFGLDDARIRAYYVPYVNYEKFIGGVGVSMDIFFPTGNFEKGLGNDTWSISPGFVFGMIFSERYSIFPNLSYRYQTRAASEARDQVDQHGGTLQLTNSIVLNDEIFLLLVPIFIQDDFAKPNSTNSGGEFEFNYMIKYNKLQLGFFTRQLFSPRTETYRIFARIFL